MKKKGKKGGKMCVTITTITNGCGGKKGTKCEIPYVMPYAKYN